MAEVRLIQGGAVRLAYREYGAAPAAPDVRLITLPAGHLVHAREPAAFISAAAAFLAEDPDR